MARHERSSPSPLGEGSTTAWMVDAAAAGTARQAREIDAGLDAPKRARPGKLDHAAYADAVRFEVRLETR